MVITSEEHNELLEELTAECSLGELEPGEVTSRMFAESSGLSLNRAGGILKEKTDKGELVFRWVRDPDGSNKRVKAYRKANK